MFILHKKHTYCSMRRNCYILVSGNIQVRSHQMKKTKQNKTIEQARTKSPIILASCTAAQLVNCCPWWGRQQSTPLVNKCSLEKIVRGAQNVISTQHILLLAKQNNNKKKSLKIIDWSHRFCLFYFAQTTFFIAQYTGRKWKWTERERIVLGWGHWPTTVKQKHLTKKKKKKKKGRKQLKIFKTLLPLFFLFVTLLFTYFYALLIPQCNLRHNKVHYLYVHSIWPLAFNSRPHNRKQQFTFLS